MALVMPIFALYMKMEKQREERKPINANEENVARPLSDLQTSRRYKTSSKLTISAKMIHSRYFNEREKTIKNTLQTAKEITPEDWIFPRGPNSNSSQLKNEGESKEKTCLPPRQGSILFQVHRDPVPEHPIEPEKKNFDGEAVEMDYLSPPRRTKFRNGINETIVQVHRDHVPEHAGVELEIETPL
ncbi:hypothetical protein AC249_AIPGENE29089 [Exaiptasia diaphana]|nr:hypothetical protein AC249_AIPGENE29089 [Exaiptasia diaphana]